MFRAAIASLVFVGVVFILAPAAPATPEETKGQLTNIKPEKLEFELKIDGEEKRTYKLDEDASTFINDRKAEFKDLRVDDQITVTDRKGGDAWYATVIRCQRPEKKDVGVVEDTRGELTSIDPPNLQFEMKVNGQEKRNYKLGEDATTYINNKVAAFQDLRVGDQLRVTDRQGNQAWYAIIIKCERK